MVTETDLDLSDGRTLHIYDTREDDADARLGRPGTLRTSEDRVAPIAHGQWLARRCPSTELWLRPDDGHISVLNSAAPAMDWLRQHAAQD